MINRLFQRGWEGMGPADRMIRQHSLWLTWAVERLAEGAHEEFPWIPTRPVDAGGFAEVTATSDGRLWADEWWDSAFLGLEESR